MTRVEDSGDKSTFTLAGIAVVSLAIVVGVTAFQNFGSSEQASTAAASTREATPSPRPQPTNSPVARAEDPVSPTRSLPTEPVPDRLRTAEIPPHTPQVAPTERPAPRPEPERAPQPVAPENAATAAINAPAPLLALVDEDTGEVKDLDPEDLQRIANLLSAQTRASQADDTVARLETAPLTTVTPPAEVEKDCVEELRELAAESTIYFLSGGAQLSPRAVAKVRAVGAAVNACPNAVVQVSGHSDPSGDEQANIAISWQRADNTIAALESMGFDTSRMDPVGFGARLPVAEGDTEPDMDRRVEFRVMEKR